MKTSSVHQSRRDFCRQVALGLPGAMIGIDGMLSMVSAETDAGQSGIMQLRLQTNRLDELRPFYNKLFHFPIAEETKNSISFQAGTTKLTFVQTEDSKQPFYHFAFNIPENKLSLAKAWLEQRVPLAHQEGRDPVYHFISWNAHSIYYWDPAGNLGELIARHDLPNAKSSGFTDEDILYASEIGIVVDDVPATVRWAEDRMRWSPYRPPAENFAAIGDEHQLLIVAKRLRPWMNKPAEIFSTGVTLRGVEVGAFELSNYPYKITVQ